MYTTSDANWIDNQITATKANIAYHKRQIKEEEEKLTSLMQQRMKRATDAERADRQNAHRLLDALDDIDAGKVTEFDPRKDEA
jgi:CRISPR/Cas system CSM-associated protein Csm2 small subunit